MSKQETTVSKFLNLLYPDVQEQVDISDITNVKLHRGIRVDFFIPSISCVVEVHGVQHFKPSGFGRNACDTANAFSRQTNRDSKLIDICKSFCINYEQINHDEEVNFMSIHNLLGKYEPCQLTL
jgi:hypothetical protein